MRLHSSKPIIDLSQVPVFIEEQQCNLYKFVIVALKGYNQEGSFEAVLLKIKRVAPSLARGYEERVPPKIEYLGGKSDPANSYAVAGGSICGNPQARLQALNGFFKPSE